MADLAALMASGDLCSATTCSANGGCTIQLYGTKRSNGVALACVDVTQLHTGRLRRMANK